MWKALKAPLQANRQRPNPNKATAQIELYKTKLDRKAPP